MKLLALFAILDIVLCIQHGADVTDITQYPFYIMIGNPHICGGTLLSYDPPLVLTSAHCIADAEFHPSDKSRWNPYFVNYNNVYRDKQKSMSIIDWSVHPLYNVSNNVNQNYDVAIVRLAKPLTQSSRVKRVPLWSPSTSSSTPKRGELVGFGYTGLDEPESPILKRMQLDITRFQVNGSFNIEARTDMESRIACHGDSGSPLIVYQSVLNPATNKHETVPFVAGNLARIFGAHDAGPNRLTCPIPHKPDHKDEASVVLPYHKANYVPASQRPQNNVIESFCNVSVMLDWISKVTGISKQNLSDPFYEPPCADCPSHDDREEDDSQGGMNQDDFSVQAVPAASSTPSTFQHPHASSFVLFITLFLFFLNLIIL